MARVRALTLGNVPRQGRKPGARSNHPETPAIITEASTCASCFVCVGVDDEELEAPTQQAAPCIYPCIAPCAACVICSVSDEALEEPVHSAVPTCIGMCGTACAPCFGDREGISA